MSFLAIIFGTFVSEDLTCIAVGLLIRRHELDAVIGVCGCFLGILVGDMGLWLLGRSFGATVLEWGPIKRRLPRHRIQTLGDWFDTRVGWLVLTSRFLPGTRLPTYVAAGVVGRRSWRFLFYAALAAALWTPLIVGTAALASEPVLRGLETVLGGGWVAVAAAVLLLFLIVKLLEFSGSAVGRARLKARIQRLWRWEFWPPWLFYIPVIPWIAYLSIRHRGFGTLTAANPGIPHGGFVGESKFDILRKLPDEWVTPTERLDAPTPEARLAQFDELVLGSTWSYPLIFKPDVGERGAGVKLIHTRDQAVCYLREAHDPILVQVYHPGPYEAGVFYYRLPGEARGRIFSITDKHFPVVVGDGHSTVEELIWNHPRYRMQADTFLARLNGQAEAVLAPGQCHRLVVAGNHCQGTMFLDGAPLITPELEQRIDQIARHFDGFHFGRFDIRFTDVEAFKAGRGFTIVELNGASSESTNIYDPSWRLTTAYRVLCRQWSLLFKIGAANRRLGHTTTSTRRLAGHARAYYRNRRIDTLSD
ncbi:MAG TPA: VTT domain-containing protein [Phycisphaerae bacterium]|nr:VTT domain-containing protein [Phycisphaerae bacterium]